MMAVQIFAAAKKAIPTLDDDIAAVRGYVPAGWCCVAALPACCLHAAACLAVRAQGRFHVLKDWLNTHVHALGSLHPNADALMVAATGEPLKPSVFIDYLRDKYTAVYKL